MNDPISWDPSLVKKFSSSSHYKLLNQLRNEVKKYPLNNKRNSSKIQKKESSLVKNNNLKVTNSQDLSIAKNVVPNKESSTNKSNVSFNNAKNFSIYNNISTNSGYQQVESDMPDKTTSKDSDSPLSFKDRLNQIDMK